MKSWIRLVALAIALSVGLTAVPVSAQVTTTINYNPRFLDANGQPLVGVCVEFWNHGDPHDLAHLFASGTTDSLGYIEPAIALTPQNIYDFVTNSPFAPSGQFAAPAVQNVVLIQGPQGPQGHAGAQGPVGPQGPTGPSGSGHGSTISINPITLSTVGTVYTVLVGDGHAFPNLGYVLVTDGTHYLNGQVTSGGTTNTLMVTSVTQSGTSGTISSSATVTFAGPPGPTGATGATGATGPAGHGSTTTTGAVVLSAVGSSYTVAVADGTALLNNGIIFVTDGTHEMRGIVTAGGGSNSLTVTSISQSATSGTIASTSPVTFSDGTGTTVSTSSVTMSTVGSSYSVPVKNGGAFPTKGFGFITDGTTSMVFHVTAGGGTKTLTVTSDSQTSISATIASGAIVSFGAPPGATGGTGPPGANGHGSTLTTGSITGSGPYTVPVSDGASFPNLAYLIVTDGTNYLQGQVTSGGGTGSLTVTATASSSPTSVANGSTVTFSGVIGATGPTGATGSTGATGAAGHGSTTTSGTITGSGPYTVPVTDGTAFTTTDYLWINDGTHNLLGHVTGGGGTTTLTVTADSSTAPTSITNGTTVTFAGQPGATGSAGANGHGTTLTTGTVTSIGGSSYTVPVADGTAFPNLGYVFVTDGTHTLQGQVTSGGGTTTLTVLAASSSSPTSITTSSPVTFSGTTGATGATGPTGSTGSTGANGHGSTTTNGAPTQVGGAGTNWTVVVNDGTSFNNKNWIFVNDGTNSIYGQITSGGGTNNLVIDHTTQVVVGTVSSISNGTTVTWIGQTGGATVTSGTSFPGGPATDQLFYRTDVKTLFHYDGTNWNQGSLYPEVIQSGFSSGTTATQTVTLGQTAGTGAGHEIIVITANLSTSAVTTPTGFTLLSACQTGQGEQICVYYRTPSGNSSDNLSVTQANTTTMSVWDFEFVDATTPAGLSSNTHSTSGQWVGPTVAASANDLVVAAHLPATAAVPGSLPSLGWTSAILPPGALAAGNSIFLATMPIRLGATVENTIGWAATPSGLSAIFRIPSNF